MPALKNARQEKFCQEIAGGLSGRQAYISAGYPGQGADASASKLQKVPKVSARIAELKQEITAGVVKSLITEKNSRIADLQFLRDNYMLLFRERQEEYANHPELKQISGGKSGFLIRRAKMIGNGPKAKLVMEFETDTAATREFCNILKQAGIETGQYSEKRELTGKDGGPISHAVVSADLTKLSDDQLKHFAEIAKALDPPKP